MTLVTSTTAASDAPKSPPNPARLFVWAVVWAAIAVLGFAVLVPDWQRVTEFDLAGQRSFGIVFFTPIIASVLAVVFAVFAVRWIRPFQRYRSRWSEQERVEAARRQLAGQPSTPFIVVSIVLAALWVAGLVAVAVFFSVLVKRPDGLALSFLLLALVATAWIPLLEAGLRRRRAGTG
jgi:hypothetical protein